MVINDAYFEKRNGLLIQDLYIYEYARITGTKDVRIYTKKDFKSSKKYLSIQFLFNPEIYCFITILKNQKNTESSQTKNLAS